MIELHNLSKSFDHKTVLKDVNLHVSKGETVVVIGRSGTGKSVLLKHVLGLLKPDAGTVTIDGVRLDQMTRVELYRLRMRCGVLFQGGALFDSLTIQQNVGLGLMENTKKSAAEIKDIVDERLEWVGLEEAGRRYPSELSGGMRKRVALARALAMRPEIVLYDEPTTGLDPVTAEGINELIVNLQEKLQVTAIAVTHDMRSAFTIGTRIAMLHDGHIVFNGTVDEAKNTDDPMLRQFIAGEVVGPLEPL